MRNSEEEEENIVYDRKNDGMVSKMWVGWDLWVMDADKWNFLLFLEIIESFFIIIFLGLIHF